MRLPSYVHFRLCDDPFRSDGANHGVAPREDHYAIRQTAEELADLQTVMRLIDVVVEEFVAEAPLRQRALVANALLNLAV
jgi:hypothetical protein